MLVSKEKVLAKLLNTAKLMSLLKYLQAFFNFLYSLFPPVLRSYTSSWIPGNTLLVRTGTLLGLPVTYLTASMGFGHCPCPPSLASPSPLPPCSSLWDYSPAPSLPKGHPKKHKTKMCPQSHGLTPCHAVQRSRHRLDSGYSLKWWRFWDAWCSQGLALLGAGNGVRLRHRWEGLHNKLVKLFQNNSH